MTGGDGLAAGNVFCSLLCCRVGKSMEADRWYVLLENVPFGQRVHWVAPGPEYAPAPQGLRFWPSGQEYPAVQDLHRVV